MTDIDRDYVEHDEDRLPWLEAVENDEDEDGLSASKLMGFVLAALIALGLVIAGVWWLRSQQGGPNGDNTLIEAQENGYKVRPEDPGGMKVDGQGDVALAASEGAEANGRVDTNARAEAPVVATKATPQPAPPLVAPAGKTVTTPVASSGGALAPAPLPAAASASGAGLIQLGAYGSQVGADQEWAKLVARVPGLSAMAKSVLPAAVGGNTVYRLRANAGTAAAAASTCAKVKGAGSPCMIVR